MARILRTYVIREAAVPTVLALLTITFILLLSQIFDLIDKLLQPGVRAMDVVQILLSFLPVMMVFATPMAILVGLLIGVGRLALDREVLAMRASGVNLFNVFAPLLGLALLLSFAIMALNQRVMPQLLISGFKRVAKLEIANVDSLEPGQFIEQIAGRDVDFVLYFAERDAATRQMRAVTLKTESDAQFAQKKQDRDKEKDKNKRKAKQSGQAGDASKKQSAAGRTPNGAAALAQAPPATAPPAPAPAEPTATPARLVPVRKSAAQKAAVPTAAPAPATSEDGAKPSNKPRGQAPKDRKPDDDEAPERADQMIIFAKSGEITTNMGGLDDGAEEVTEGAIMLTLHDGTLHRLSADPAKRDYVLMHFDRMRKVLTVSVMDALKKNQRGRASEQLRKMVRDRDVKLDRRGAARRELTERVSMPLACFVFALIGIPLAIWVRPSGKSWGILLAVALMLVYYVLMKMGLTMVEQFKPLGIPMAYMPNVLFAALGAGFWWRTLRS